MSKFLILTLAILITYSCDNPRGRRVKISKSNESAYNFEGSTGSGGSGSSSGGTNSGTTQETANIPTDAKHCRFSNDGQNNYESSSNHLGSYTLCQSSTDKNVFYIQIKTPPVDSTGDVSVCFIPQTTSGTTSIFVGDPMCSTFPDPKMVKKITFQKYNSYSNALINSVIFFKDSKYYYPAYEQYINTLEAYGICMSELSKGVSKYCDSFKQVGQYVIKNF